MTVFPRAMVWASFHSSHFLILANGDQASLLGSRCFTARIRVRRLPATNGKYDRQGSPHGV